MQYPDVNDQVHKQLEYRSIHVSVFLNDFLRPDSIKYTISHSINYTISNKCF